MAMATIRKPLTQCGLYGNRAKVIASDGGNLTYRWPCGYERTEPLMQGPRGMKRPAPAAVVALFSRYWANGVTYECPRCRRAAAKRKGG